MARKTMETRSLTVDLTDEQVESRSRQLARGHLDLAKDRAELDRRKSDQKAAWKAEEKGLDRRAGELDSLAQAVATRKIKTDVDCDWRYYLGPEGSNGTKILVRRDTGQAIEQRPVTTEERQLVIGERLEEANEEQLKIWEEQLATANASAVEEPAAEKGDGEEAGEDEEEPER